MGQYTPNEPVPSLGHQRDNAKIKNKKVLL